MTFSPGIKKWKWQLALIPAFSIIISVVLSKRMNNQNPWEFPFALCLTLGIFIFCIWEANLLPYRLLDKKMPFYENVKKRFIYQVFYGWLATWLSFMVLYIVMSIVYQAAFNINNFLFYLLIATGISTIINALYVLRYITTAFYYQDAIKAEAMNRQLDDLRSEVILQSSVPKEQAIILQTPPLAYILVDAGVKTFQLPLDALAYCYSSEGMVSFVKKDGQKILTNYTSFAAVTDKLPAKDFFQLNRQYIVHISAIKSVKDDANRKLIAELSPGRTAAAAAVETVTISRYRAAEFKKWFINMATA